MLCLAHYGLHVRGYNSPGRRCGFQPYGQVPEVAIPRERETMSMTEQLLERLNEMALILDEPKWCPWRPSPEEMEFHGSPVLAWLSGPPWPVHATADALKLSPSGAIRFGEAWGYIQAVADSCNQTISELLDGVGIEPIPGSALVRRAQ
jgi:hypothetical protein